MTLLSTMMLVTITMVCVSGQAFFSGSEMALVSADRLQLQTRADAGSSGAALALRLLERDDRLLGTCLIGTNLSLVSGATVVAMALSYHGVDSAVLAAACFAPFGLIFGEALPKTVLQHHGTQLAPWLAYPLSAAQTVFAPGLFVVTHWSGLLERITGARTTEPATREDIVGLLDDDGPSAAITPGDRRLIRRVFELTETPVEDCMTPLIKVDAVSATAPASQAVQLANRGHRSRLPVYRDRVDNIVGLVHAQDLLFGADDDIIVEEIMDEITFVPESMRVADLLHETRMTRNHLVAVVDEYGGAVGIVTIEDLLEEVIGEIRDERDRDGPRILRLGEREWRVPARIEIDELADTIGYPIPEGDYETLAGMILEHEGKIPSIGDEVQLGALRLLIEDATDRAIVTVRLTVAWTPTPL